MNVLLLAPALEVSENWYHAITAAVPGANIVQDGALPDEEITVAIVDSPPCGRLAKIPNLMLIMSLSSGIDAMMCDPSLPEVPIVRLVTQEMIALMREYVCYQVLRIHRGFAAIEQLQRELRWEWLSAAEPAISRRVFVLGLGEIGRPCAEALRDLGFQVFGWSRSKKRLRDIQCVSGEGGFWSLLPQTDILVNLLPLTSLTKHLLSARVFRQLRRGASVVNVGRGECLNELELIAALDSGQLSHATLDVFDVEPLPFGHPLWSHPKVTITPHTAAYPSPDSFIGPIVDNLERFARGELLSSVARQHSGCSTGDREAPSVSGRLSPKESSPPAQVRDQTAERSKAP